MAKSAKRAKPEPVEDPKQIPSEMPPEIAAELIPAPTPDRYIVDTLLRRNEIHVWGGSAHVGKTTHLIQTIDAWRRGRGVFGFPSHPAPFCYVASDRAVDSIQDTLDRIEVEASQELPFRLVSLGCSDAVRLSLEDAISCAMEAVSGLEVIFLDGLLPLVPGNPNHYRVVADFLIRGINLMRANNLTLVATVAASKAKANEHYLNCRHRIHGSSAWGDICSTVAMIDYSQPEDPRSLRRTVTVSTRNFPVMVREYELDGMGRFVSFVSDQSTAHAFDEAILAMGESTDFTSSDINEWCELLKISRDTAERRLRERLIPGGLVRKVSHGLYTVLRKQ